MDQLMEALLTDSEVRIQIADNLPDKVQAQYIPNKRTIYVRNGMSEMQRSIPSAGNWRVHPLTITMEATAGQGYRHRPIVRRM